MWHSPKKGLLRSWFNLRHRDVLATIEKKGKKDTLVEVFSKVGKLEFINGIITPLEGAASILILKRNDFDFNRLWAALCLLQRYPEKDFVGVATRILTIKNKPSYPPLWITWSGNFDEFEKGVLAQKSPGIKAHIAIRRFLIENVGLKYEKDLRVILRKIDFNQENANRIIKSWTRLPTKIPGYNPRYDLNQPMLPGFTREE